VCPRVYPPPISCSDCLFTVSPLRVCRAVRPCGGSSAKPQLEALAAGVEIVVATPGRLADFLERPGPPMLSLARCAFLVLDEGDRMLDMVGRGG
jgi:superfamily II DNA/RNA helicase